MSARYIDGFESAEDVVRQFEAPKDALEAAEVLFASYENEGYEGSAIVVYRKDGKLWEVNGGHCSCFGLEGQWEPEETSREALAKRSVGFYSKDAKKAFERMLVELESPRVITRVMDDGVQTKDGAA